MTENVVKYTKRFERQQRAMTLEDVMGTKRAGQFHLKYPAEKYRNDPVGFARDILGVELWDKMIEMMELVRDNQLTAVKAGNKCSKSFTAAVLALWWFCCWDDARVILTAPTLTQVDDILYGEVSRLHETSGICLECKREGIVDPCRHSPGPIDGICKLKARTGIRIKRRSITGNSAKEAEQIAGRSSEHIFYIIDEASGYDTTANGLSRWKAILGNLAGGGKILMISNPTRSEGIFYDAFNAANTQFVTMTIRSDETPNAKTGKRVIGGLAVAGWIPLMIAMFGPDDDMVRVRINGEFPQKEQGKLFSLHLLGLAEVNNETATMDGPLFVGIDCAGEGKDGDESAFVVRIGKRMMAIRRERGLDVEGHHRVLQELLAEWGTHNRKNVVNIDSLGVGNPIFKYLAARADVSVSSYEICEVRASDAPPTWSAKNEFNRTRDFMYFNLKSHLLAGAGLLPDLKLQAELHAFEGSLDSRTGKKVVTGRDELVRMLKRSADTATAVALAFWAVGTSLGDVECEPLPPTENPSRREIMKTMRSEYTGGLRAMKEHQRGPQ